MGNGNGIVVVEPAMDHDRGREITALDRLVGN
jgi:hypothetical protein